MKSLLIVNSAAGQHRNDDVFDSLRDAFGRHMPQIAATQYAGHAREIALNAANSGDFDAVVAVGGDGTVNEVVNGLMAASAVGKPFLGVIPTGTCNILASELGIPWPNVAGAVDVLVNAKSAPIDVCRVRDRYFLLMASFGIDAQAVRDVVLPIKGLVGPGAYVFSGLAAFAHYEPANVRMWMDDDYVELQAFAVVVANVSTYGFSGVKIAPFAALDDGWLDVCIFEKPPSHRIGFLGQVMLLLARRHLGDPRVRYYRARRIEVQSDPPIAAQLDGDDIGDTPVIIDIVPHALTMIVP